MEANFTTAEITQFLVLASITIGFCFLIVFIKRMDQKEKNNPRNY